MKHTSQRTRDFAIYLTVGFFVVAGITVSALYTAHKALDPHGMTKWIGPGLQTGLVFGFAIKWYQRFLKTKRLWIALALLFFAHCVVLWLVATSVGPIPLVYWWLGAVLEQLLLTWGLDQVVRRKAI